jgi:hypothetical protein
MCNYFCVFKYILFVHDRHFTHVQCKIDFSMSLECFYSFIFIFHLSYTKYLYDNFCITKNIFSSRLGQGALYTTTWTSLCTQLHKMIDIYSHLENTCMGALFYWKGVNFWNRKAGLMTPLFLYWREWAQSDSNIFNLFSGSNCHGNNNLVASLI